MPNVMPNAALIDAELYVGSKIEKLQKLAIEHNGACLKKFSQGSDDRTMGVGYWYHGRLTGGNRWGGVCKALCVYWIAFHANEDDFWGWLMKNGWGQVESVGQIIELHGHYKGGRGGLSKNAWLADRLSRAGVKEKHSVTGLDALVVTGAADQIMGSGRSFLAGALLAKAIAPDWTALTEGYRQLSFGTPSGAAKSGRHAVALWVAQDVVLFDPNYGEYWFETVSDFRKWFPKFWEATGYGNKYTGNYQIAHYVKPV